MTNKTKQMYNRKKLYSQEIQKLLTEDGQVLPAENFASIKDKNYSTLGMDYWSWMDFLANLEATFSKDLAETTDKFKIETIDELIDALYCAPDVKSLYRN